MEVENKSCMAFRSPLVVSLETKYFFKVVVSGGQWGSVGSVVDRFVRLVLLFGETKRRDDAENRLLVPRFKANDVAGENLQRGLGRVRHDGPIVEPVHHRSNAQYPVVSRLLESNSM